MNDELTDTIMRKSELSRPPFAVNDAGNERVGNAVSARQRADSSPFAIQHSNLGNIAIRKFCGRVLICLAMTRRHIDVFPRFAAKSLAHVVRSDAKLPRKCGSAIPSISGFIAQARISDDLLSQFRSSLAIAFGLTAMISHVLHIVQMRAFGKVSWVAAWPIVANQMTDKTNRRSTVCERKRYAVRPLVANARDVELPIPVAQAARPRPTGIRPTGCIDVRPESALVLSDCASANFCWGGRKTFSAHSLETVRPSLIGQLRVKRIPRQLSLASFAFEDRLEAHVIPPESYAMPRAAPTAPRFLLPQLYLGGSYADH